MGNEPTGNTTKMGLRLSIRLFAMTARNTGSACVARVNGNQSDTGHLRLIRQEGAQLPETPTVVQQSLSLPQPYPLVYSRQILNGNTALRASGFADQLLADAMIDITRHACFFATALSQKPLRAFGAFLLQFAPQAHITHPNRVQGFCGVDLPIAINSNVGHAQVHTQKLFWRCLGRFGQVNRRIE